MNIRTITSKEVNALLSLYKHLHKSDDPVPKQAVVDAVWKELARMG